VQGLYAAYNRTGDAGLRAYLGAFISTQVRTTSGRPHHPAALSVVRR
jgi:hypothetical protein